jgi:hypothetical protein
LPRARIQRQLLVRPEPQAFLPCYRLFARKGRLGLHHAVSKPSRLVLLGSGLTPKCIRIPRLASWSTGSPGGVDSAFRSLRVDADKRGFARVRIGLLLDRVLVLVRDLACSKRVARVGLVEAKIAAVALVCLRLVGRGLRQREEFQRAVLVASRAELLGDGKACLP